MSLVSRFSTHETFNLPEPLPPCNLWHSDIALRESVALNGGDWAQAHLDAHGAVCGDELMVQGELANRHRPRFHPCDRYGRRIDHVEFHPAYHEVMRIAMAAEVHSFSWRHADTPGAHVVRAALMYLTTQPEAGTGCPLTMTHAAVAALRHAPALAEEWIPRLIATEYDPRTLPASRKTACTVGMGMTEKQGGTDVRKNTTRAHPKPDGSHELVGHKYFFSAPMCDAHLVLAQTDAGLSCFLVPRVLDDGSLNAVHVRRLKDKLGDWSNASSEVEFRGARALLLGPEGRGIASIFEMVAMTRLDCMIGSAAGMRQALVQALHYTAQRDVFGKLLIDQPLMRNVLADLALESEAALALAMRCARAVDASARDPREAALARIAVPIGKYWICKRTPGMVNEAQECIGGIGYVEDHIMPRLYRQAPLNSIWEGSGNVQCLDVLRAFAREPQSREVLLDELVRVRGVSAAYDMQLDGLLEVLDDGGDMELRSRRIVEHMALLLQASLLLQGPQRDIGMAFCEGRLGPDSGKAYGTLPADAPLDLLIQRAMPVFD